MNSSDRKLERTARAQLKPRRVITFIVLAFLLIFLLLARPGYRYLRAAGLLLRIEDPQHAGLIGGMHAYTIEESVTEIRTPAGSSRARLYAPKDVPNAPGMLIVHGVHHLGIDDPRLVAFARALSAGGIRVLRRRLLALTDYLVDASSIQLIGDTARDFSQSLRQKVGILGIRFRRRPVTARRLRPALRKAISAFVVSSGLTTIWSACRNSSSRTKSRGPTAPRCKWPPTNMARSFSFTPT